MRLAILMANTDESAFAKRHPDDGEKFTTLIQRARPDWAFDVFFVKDGIFPDSLDFDGFLITGSPASVHDKSPWIPKLESLVRDIHARNLPIFGACFGHQVIAKALGASVESNPQGWVLGRIDTHLDANDAPTPLYAAHKEQVVQLPEGAKTVATTPGCAIAGFAIGSHILTTQYHPEMTQAFVAALLEAFEDDIGTQTTRKAATTLTVEPDRDALADWIVHFFENAASVKAT